MDKRKVITIAIIVALVCIFIFGGVTLSNKITKDPNTSENTESKDNEGVGTNKEDTEISSGNNKENNTENTNKTENKEDLNTEDTSLNTENKNETGSDNTTPNQTPNTENNTGNTNNTPGTESTDTGNTGLENTNSNTSSDTKPKYTFTDLNKTMYATSSVNVRNLPSADGDKVGSLSKGQEVKVTGQCNETKWYRITLNGTTAYVSNNYLSDKKPVAESTPSTPSTPNTPNTPSTPPANEQNSTVQAVYSGNEIGDGLDEYRKGLHKWTPDGKHQLYVLTTYDGYSGYWFYNEDDKSDFSNAFENICLGPESKLFLSYSSSKYYEYSEYQFMKYYDYDENGDKIYGCYMNPEKEMYYDEATESWIIPKHCKDENGNWYIVDKNGNRVYE